MVMNTSSPRLIGLGAVSAVLAGGSVTLAPLPAGAQTLEEIVVTARRREESLQDVPISVVAYQGEEITLAGISDYEDLNVAVPNFSANSNPIFGETSTVSVARGVPGVATYIDGVETTGANLLTREFVDIERIEVLRGPQGTLFGRGTLSGAVQIVTRAPGEELGGRIEGTLGAYDRTDFKASIDVPITDTLRTRFSAAALTRDGYVQNLEPGGLDYGDMDDTVLRADVYMEPSGSFSIRGMWDRQEFVHNGNARVLAGLTELPRGRCPGPGCSLLAQYSLLPGFFEPLTTPTDFSTDAGIGEWNVRTSRNLPNADEQEINQFTLDANWGISDNLRLRSITGYRTLGQITLQETDGTRFFLFDEFFYRDIETLTQEVQLLGNMDRFNWVLGLYHYEQENLSRRTTFAQADIKSTPGAVAALRSAFGCRPQPPPPGRPEFPPCRARIFPSSIENVFSGTEDETNALFGEITWLATDRLNLTLGFRHNRDDNLNRRHQAANLVGSAMVPTTAIPADRVPVTRVSLDEALASTPVPRFDHPSEFTSTTFRGVVAYAFNDDVNAYVSYSEGFGPGHDGVITDPIALRFFGGPLPWTQEPEEVEMWEAGVKSTLLDNRLRMNAALFAGAWLGPQLANPLRDPRTGQPLPVVFPINAGKARMDGLELDMSFVPNSSWLFNFSLGWLDARYTDVGEATVITTATPFLNTPELSYSLNGQYRWDLSNGANLLARLNYGWKDEYSTSQTDAGRLIQPAYGLWNARLVFTTPSDAIQVTLFGENLTNEYYLLGGASAVSIGSVLSYAGRPREYGLRVNFLF